MKKKSSKPSVSVLMRQKELMQGYGKTFQDKYHEIMRMSSVAKATYVTGDQYSITYFTYTKRLVQLDELVATKTGIPVNASLYYNNPPPPPAVTRRALRLAEIDLNSMAILRNENSGISLSQWLK